MAGTDDDGIVASDTEREAVAERLSAALGEGRLDLAAFEERSGAAMHARTRGELARLTADLPVSRAEKVA